MRLAPAISLALLLLPACAARQPSANMPPPEQATADWVRNDKIIPMLNPEQANPLAYATQAQDGLNGIAKKVQRCYKKELKDRPRLHGEMVVGMLVPPSGIVDKAWVSFSTVPSLRMEACLLPLFEGLELASPGQEPVELLHPYVFTSSKTPPEIEQALRRLHKLEDPDDRGQAYPNTQESEEFDSPW